MKKYLLTLLLALVTMATWAASAAGDPFYFKNTSTNEATFQLEFNNQFDFTSNPIYLEYSTDNSNWTKVTGGWQGCPCEEGSCECTSEGGECSCDGGDNTCSCDACSENYSLTVSVPAGSTIYLRAQQDKTNTLAYYDSENYYYVNAISTIGFANIEDEGGGDPTIVSCTIGGDITTLISQNGNVESLGAGFFNQLFNGNTGITDASDLILPSTTLAADCYYQMFDNCTALTAAPALPATTLAAGCYSSMFSGCIALTTINTIAATRSAITATESEGIYCTDGMFSSVGGEVDGNTPEVTAILTNLDVADLVLGTAASIKEVKYSNYTQVGSYTNASEYTSNLKTDETYSSIFGSTTFTKEGGGTGDKAFDGGTGTQDDPYQINTKVQMTHLIALLDGSKAASDFDDVSDISADTYYKLTADLDYSNGACYFLYDGDMALGNSKAQYNNTYKPNFANIKTNTDPATAPDGSEGSTGAVFKGHFDGGNHTIAGIKGANGKTSNDDGTSNGLFYSAAPGSTFENLAVVNSYSLFGVVPDYDANNPVTFTKCYFSFHPQYFGDTTYPQRVSFVNCYWIEYTASSKSVCYEYDTNGDGGQNQDVTPPTADGTTWVKDELSMTPGCVLKDLAITLKGDDGKSYVTDKLMRQPKNNVMLYEETPTVGTEYKYNVYTESEGAYTIQNLYLNDYSWIVYTYNWSKVKDTFGESKDAAAAATSIVWNHNTNPTVNSINYKRVDTTYKGNTDSWNTFYLPFDVYDHGTGGSGTTFHFCKADKDDKGNDAIGFVYESTDDELGPYIPSCSAFIFNPNKKSIYDTGITALGITVSKIGSTTDYLIDLSMAYYPDNHYLEGGPGSNHNAIVNFTGAADLSKVSCTSSTLSGEDVFTGTFKLVDDTNKATYLSQGLTSPVTKTNTNGDPSTVDIFTYKLKSDGITFNYTTSSSWLYPFRAILQIPVVTSSEAKATDAYAVIIGSDASTAIQSVSNTPSADGTSAARKVLKNGRLVIEKDGKTYTVAGQQM